MDQKKTGLFLKTLRKEKNITQEVLAETLNVSGRTVSRWETGSNMPDISMLVELSEFYQVSISEIIDGERKSEKMNQETKNTVKKMAEYSKYELRTEKQKILNILFMIFGVFIMISALAIFPNDSSWGSIYAIIGAVIAIVGIYLGMKSASVKKGLRILSVVGCTIVLFGVFTILDYIAVSQFHQVPRFCYEKSYGEDIIEYKTLFYTVIRERETTNETIETAKKESNAESDQNNTAGYYECMENPIDPLFAEALHDSHDMIRYQQIQELYYDTWKQQYEEIMKRIRDQCKYAEDIANYELFTREMEDGFDHLQPLILNEMLDNYNMPASSEKNSWGNGTRERLLMYQGTMYRNACMFFIPLLEVNEYAAFPLNEVEQNLSVITES